MLLNDALSHAVEMGNAEFCELLLKFVRNNDWFHTYEEVLTKNEDDEEGEEEEEEEDPKSHEKITFIDSEAPLCLACDQSIYRKIITDTEKQNCAIDGFNSSAVSLNGDFVLSDTISSSTTSASSQSRHILVRHHHRISEAAFAESFVSAEFEDDLLQNPLLIACIKDDFKTVQMLVEWGFNLDDQEFGEICVRRTDGDIVSNQLMTYEL